MLASRMSRIASSPTLKGLLAADRLRSQGMDVVDLGAGEPDFPTPDHVKAAARAAIDGNFTKYTANAGIANLREAIARRYATDYGVSFTDGRGDRHRRRQAGARQRGAGGVRPRRRGDHARRPAGRRSSSRSSSPTPRR